MSNEETSERDRDLQRWKVLAHRAIDDAFCHFTEMRFYPGDVLTPDEEAEFRRLDEKLGFPSRKVATVIETAAGSVRP
jgi:hypothetical protein